MDYNIGTRSFKDTKVYQEAFEEGRLEGLVQSVPRLLDLSTNKAQNS
ncbi:MAG: hypothetical protein ACYT04_64930 [Nostoc sp.]